MEEWLQSLMAWGTEILVRLQMLGISRAEPIWQFFTFLGYTEFYLFMLPLIYWCIDKRNGAALGYLAMFSTWLANAIKFVFNIPRPADSRLRIPWPETTPSFLSGHALSAVANWGFVALRFRNPVVTILAVIAIIGIPLSRMFLGVHFPQDIIGGLLLGFLLLIVFNGAEPSVSRWLSRQTVPVQLALAIAVPVLLIFVHPADPAAGYPARGAVQTMSALVGLGIGLVMDRAWLRFSVDGTLLQRLVRLLLGLLLVAVFYVGPRLIVPDGLAYGAELGITFLHYALLGWTTAFLAPWLFCKVGLAGHESPVSAAAAPSTPAADASRPG